MNDFTKIKEIIYSKIQTVPKVFFDPYSKIENILKAPLRMFIAIQIRTPVRTKLNG